MSVNRGKYSKLPENVLYNILTGEHYSSHSIIEFQVSLVESQKYTHPQKAHINYRFKMFHVPEECMYPHSEIKIMENAKISQDLPKSLRGLFRDEIMKHYNKVERH